MKLNRTFSILTSVLVLISMAISACGTPTPSSPTSVSPTEAATAASTEGTPSTPTEGATEAATQSATQAPTGNIDCMGAQAGDELTIVYQWSGAEEESFNAILKPFVDACGVKITAQSTRDDAVLDTMVKSTPPDVLFWPNLSPIKLYSDKLMALDTVGANKDNYASFWFDMLTVDGKWVAIPVKADVKSLIWYSPAQFSAFGYEVPTTFDDLKTLVDKMAADGNVPWSMGFNNGGAGDGWAGTDFIEDILLATQGPDFVDKLLSGDVAYNDQGMIDAFTLYQKWASDPKYTVGGVDGTVNTKFLDAIYNVFSNPPKAMMVRQSGFAGGEIAKQFPDLKYGQDFDFFLFPGVQGVQGGADFMFAFSDKPAAKALVAYLTSDLGGETWAGANLGLSPNKAAVGKYTDPQLSKLGDILDNATSFSFDLGDRIGAPFNEAEFKGVVSIVQGADIKSILDTIAAALSAALNK